MKQREDRQAVLIRARLHNGKGWSDIAIRNVSRRGLGAEAGCPPQRGSYVEIFRGAMSIIGRVIWTNGHRFGVRAQQHIDLQALLDQPSLPRTARNEKGQMVRLERRNDPDRLCHAQIHVQIARSRRIATAIQYGALLSGTVAMAVIASGMAETHFRHPMRIDIGYHSEPN